MLRLIPLDVWAAGILAVAILLMSVFDPASVVFGGAVLAAFAYVAFEAFRGKLN